MFVSQKLLDATQIKLRLFSLDFTTPWCVTPRMLDEYARYALVVGAI